jgi:hypothetical protein
VPNFRLWAGWQIRDALNLYTRRARTGGHRVMSLDTPIDDDFTLHDVVPDEDVPLPDVLGIASVCNALAALPKADAELLRACADAAHHEVAAARGVPRSTITQRHTRALARLAELLGAAPAAKRSRQSRPITWRGETHTAAEWSRRLGIDRRKLSARLQRVGGDLEAAVQGCV